MIDVSIPYDKVMIFEYDSESPWKEQEIVDPVIVDWLDQHEPNWDWGFDFGVPYFRFKDAKVAMLFKLTWG